MTGFIFDKKNCLRDIIKMVSSYINSFIEDKYLTFSEQEFK